MFTSIAMSRPCDLEEHKNSCNCMLKEDIDKRKGTLKHVQVQSLPFTSSMLALTYLLQRRLGQSKNKKVKG